MCVCMRICVTGNEIALILHCPLEVGLICVCVFERIEEGYVGVTSVGYP